MNKKHIWTHHSAKAHFTIISDIRARKYPLAWIERYTALFLCIIKLLFPMRWISHFTKHHGSKARNRALEIYMLSKVAIIFTCLFAPVPSTIAIIITIYILADIWQYLLWLIFLSNVYTKLPAIKRNFSHLTLNVSEIVWWFAVLFLHLWAVWTGWIPITQWRDALYFSMITFSTIWYWDIVPLTMLWKQLIIGETLMSFLFITIIVACFVSGLNIKTEE